MPSQSSSDSGGRLHKNIPLGAAGYIRVNLAALDKKHEEMLTQLPVIDEALLSGKPQFLFKAEDQAKAQGCSLQAILDKYRRELRESNYPTPQCLFPDELVDYMEGRPLSEARLWHAEHCQECSSLLFSLLPAGAIIDERSAAQEEIDQLLFANPNRGLPKRPEGVPVVAGQDRPCRVPSRRARRNRRFVKNLAAALLPATFIAAGGYVLLLLVGGSQAAAEIQVPYSWFYGAAALAFWLSLITIFKGFSSVRMARLVLCSCLCGVFLAVCGFINYWQNSAAVAIAFHWAENRAELVALSAIEEQTKTGKFPTAMQLSTFTQSDKDGIGPLNVSDPQPISGGAVYVLTAPHMPGELIAEVGTETPNLEWKSGMTVLKRIDIVPAMIEAGPNSGDDAQDLMIKVDGQIYKYHNLDPNNTPPDPGQAVIAPLHFETKSFSNYRVISYSPSRPR